MLLPSYTTTGGTTIAIRLSQVVAIGDIDLSIDYKSRKLEEIGAALGLTQETKRIAIAACLAVNWPILAQVKMGAPRNLFANECMAEMPLPDDPIGLHLLEKHWPQVERLAAALLREARLSGAISQFLPKF